LGAAGGAPKPSLPLRKQTSGAAGRNRNARCTLAIRRKRDTRLSENCEWICENRRMDTVQSNGRGTGGVTGRGFKPGRSGNPGGRPQGLARATRELVGEDGMALAQLWWDIARDETRRDRDRLEASKLLADRGWGKAAVFSPQEGDPLDLAALEGAAEEFRTAILRLAPSEPDGA
jgi:hypothetical protein